jgi:hypothetical protein
MIGCRHLRAIQVYPGLTSWVILSRPCGTGLAGDLTQHLRAGLLSAVPSGLVPNILMTGLFSASVGQIR